MRQATSLAFRVRRQGISGASNGRNPRITRRAWQRAHRTVAYLLLEISTRSSPARLRVHAEERGMPQRQARQLAHLRGADHGADPVRHGGTDGVLGDVALDASVVVAGRVPGERAALHLHLVRALPGAGDHLAAPSHRLAVAGHDADRAQVVQDVWAAIVCGRMRLSENATSSGIEGSRWWHTISMSLCSATVFTVNGRVGLVELGSTLASPHTRRVSGAWPPPAPYPKFNLVIINLL